jgi:hypothetical protein
MCNPRKRSHLVTAEKEDGLNKASLFLYHYDRKKHKDHLLCSNQKVKGARKETYFYCKTCINQPAMCPRECFERYDILKHLKRF